jgi:hypothetical protein
MIHGSRPRDLLVIGGLTLLGLSMLTVLARPLAATQAEALFHRGATWTEFLATVVVNRAEWEHKAAAAEVSAAAVRAFASVAGDLELLVVAEDWCRDSLESVPYVARLSAASGVEMRIVNRRLGAPLMAAHRTPDGRTATPTVLFLKRGQDAGAWVERPEPARLSIVDLLKSAAQDPSPAHSRLKAWYERDGGRTTVAEIIAIARTL